MSQHDPVSAAWRAHRAYLVDLAFRMVGDIGVAEDMVQEAFSRLLRAPVGDIDDERGWLIVVTSRLCLDHIKSASTRRERPQDIAAWHDGDASVSSVDPADRVTLDDEVRLALLIMLERLGPAERVVFVLHEIFGLPYQQIATTIGSQASTCRQLAHRARRKINESRIAASVEPAQHRVVTRAFIEACSNGDLDTLLEVLDPGVAGEIDARKGVVVVGADRVGPTILRHWSHPATVLVAQPVCGQPAVLAFVNRALAGVLALSIEAGKITKIHVWRDVLLRLANDFRCVAIDAPGCGLSDRLSTPPTLAQAADAITSVIDALQLRDLTLVAHDLGGPAGFLAAARRGDRVAALAAVNCFAWRPTGPLFRGMLAAMGSAPVRELDAAINALARATSTRFGAGRHWSRADRAAFRAGIDAPARRAWHAYFRDARRAHALYTDVDAALRGGLADRPLLTIFGQFNDPLRFQPRWKELFPTARQLQVRRGNHFPMCDDPDLVAGALTSFVQRST